MILVQKVLAAVCDEHTSISLKNKFSSFYPNERVWFPGLLMASKEGLYLEHPEQDKPPQPLAQVRSRVIPPKINRI